MIQEQGYQVIRDPRVGQLQQRMRDDFHRLAQHYCRMVGLADQLREDDDLAALVSRLNQFEQGNEHTGKLFSLLSTSVQCTGLSSDPFLLELAHTHGIAEPTNWFPPQLRFDRPHDTYFASPPHQDFGSSFLSPNGLVIWFSLNPQRELHRLDVWDQPYESRMLPLRRSGPDKQWPHEMDQDFDEDQWRTIELDEDELLVFTPFLVHRSPVNATDAVKISLQVRYLDWHTLPEPISPFRYVYTDYLKDKIEAMIQNG